MDCNEMNTSCRNQDVENFETNKSLYTTGAYSFHRGENELISVPLDESRNQEKTVLYATGDYSFYTAEDISTSVSLNESQNQEERSMDQNTQLDNTVPYVSNHKNCETSQNDASVMDCSLVPKTEEEDNGSAIEEDNVSVLDRTIASALDGNNASNDTNREMFNQVQPKEEEKEFINTVQVNMDNEEKLKPPQPISEIKLNLRPSSKPIKKEKRKYFRKHYSTEQLQEALQKCREGVSIRECSKQFGIPKSTLWDKLSSRTPAEVMRPGRSIKVSPEVENR